MNNEIVAAIIQGGITALGTFFTIFYTIKLVNKQIIYSNQLQKKILNLQWFKEIIIEPNLNEIISFFDTIEKWAIDVIDNPSKELIKDLAKKRRTFFKVFVNIVESVDESLHKRLYRVVDNLETSLLNIIDKALGKTSSNNTLDEIEEIIKEARKDFLKQIYGYYKKY